MPKHPDRIAEQAEYIVNNHTDTKYTHSENIIVATGVYHCDCSEFVGFVLEQIAPDHYASIVATAPPRPPLLSITSYFSRT